MGLGQCPRGAPSFTDEQLWCDLGALEARNDPTSIFAMQNLARVEAQKAFVHVDCFKRIQRARFVMLSLSPWITK